MSGILGSTTVLREFYDRLVKKGKPKKVAVTACARKLLLFAFARYKKAMEELQLQMA